MREFVAQRMEHSEQLNRQFGLHRFEDDGEWWPESMRREFERARQRRSKKSNGRNGHATVKI